MRLLVACPKCNRQYDASTLKVGNRFRCHCGTVLTVQEPRGHDAAVVCCAHCGAPRSDGALKCAYCGADFTLHERDLDTVCPHCLTRVSNKAKFCHFCGAAIQPEMIVGQSSQLICPACGPEHTLISRAWADISVMECTRCAGLWLSGESFKHLTEEAAAEGNNVDWRQFAPKTRAAEADVLPPDGGHRYRPCAVCHQLMVKRNFGRQSGVIIDVCGRHGVWFDADELPRILDWIHAGGLAQAHEEELSNLQDEATLQKNLAMGDAAEIVLGRNYLNTQRDSFLLQALRDIRNGLSRF